MQNKTIKSLEGQEEVHTGDTFSRAFHFLGSDSRRLQQDSSSTVSTRTGLPQNELKCASGSYKSRANFELSLGFSFFSRCQEKNEFGWLSKIIFLNPGEYNLFIDSKIRFSLTKILFGKTTIK